MIPTWTIIGVLSLFMILNSIIMLLNHYKTKEPKSCLNCVHHTMKDRYEQRINENKEVIMDIDDVMHYCDILYDSYIGFNKELKDLKPCGLHKYKLMPRIF